MISSRATKAEDRRGRQATTLVATIAIYGITSASMATVGVVVPQMDQLASDLDALMAELGFAIGVSSLPAALCSIPLGAVIDGAKYALTLAAPFSLAADAPIYMSSTLLTLQIGLATAGIANAIIITAAPALLMTALSGQSQVRAMSPWSAYGPAGYALGLPFGAPFRTDPNGVSRSSA